MGIPVRISAVERIQGQTRSCPLDKTAADGYIGNTTSCAEAKKGRVAQGGQTEKELAGWKVPWLIFA